MEDARRVFVDVAIPTSRRRAKLHVAYDPAARKMIKVKKLTELWSQGYTEVYLDAVFPETYEEIMQLLQRGVKVYLLRGAEFLKIVRSEAKLEKSDENDALILSKIPSTEFRQLTIEELKLKSSLRMFIRLYEEIVREIKVLKAWRTRRFGANSREYLMFLDSMLKERRRMKERISKIIRERISLVTPLYKKALEVFELSESVELAILVYELGQSLQDHGVNKLKGYLGLYDRARKYNRRLRWHLSALAKSLLLRYKRYGKPRIIGDCFRSSENIWKTLCRIQTKVIKVLKRLAVGEGLAGQ